MIKIIKYDGSMPNVKYFKLRTSTKDKYIGYWMVYSSRFHCVLPKHGKSLILRNHKSFLYCGLFSYMSYGKK